MANYNYVDMVDLADLYDNLCVLRIEEAEIVSSRGSKCFVQHDDWVHDGKLTRVIHVEGKNSHYVLCDTDTLGITFARFVFNVLLAMNCKLKDYDGTMRELNLCSGTWIVNNPRHELFGKLVDVKTGEVIA